jgi:hypothetical protein
MISLPPDTGPPVAVLVGVDAGPVVAGAVVAGFVVAGVVVAGVVVAGVVFVGSGVDSPQLTRTRLANKTTAMIARTRNFFIVLSYLL